MSIILPLIIFVNKRSYKKRVKWNWKGWLSNRKKEGSSQPESYWTVERRIAECVVSKIELSSCTKVNKKTKFWFLNAATSNRNSLLPNRNSFTVVAVVIIVVVVAVVVVIIRFFFSTANYFSYFCLFIDNIWQNKKKKKKQKNKFFNNNFLFIVTIKIIHRLNSANNLHNLFAKSVLISVE